MIRRNVTGIRLAALMICLGMLFTLVVDARPSIKFTLSCETGTPPHLVIKIKYDDTHHKLTFVKSWLEKKDQATGAWGFSMSLESNENPSTPHTYSTKVAVEDGATYRVKAEASCDAKHSTQETSEEMVCKAVAAVPILTQWGLIALGLLLAGSLAWVIRRRFSMRPAGV